MPENNGSFVHEQWIVRPHLFRHSCAFARMQLVNKNTSRKICLQHRQASLPSMIIIKILLYDNPAKWRHSSNSVSSHTREWVRIECTPSNGTTKVFRRNEAPVVSLRYGVCIPNGLPPNYNQSMNKLLNWMMDIINKFGQAQCAYSFRSKYDAELFLLFWLKIMESHRNLSRKSLKCE